MISGFSFSSIFTAAGMAKLGQIVVGDLTMAGDNVVIMGSLASGLPARDRRKVLMFGVGMALIFLIFFAVIATQLLKVTGLVFAGGLLLLWVAYNMIRELHPKASVIAAFSPKAASSLDFRVSSLVVMGVQRAMVLVRRILFCICSRP